LIFNQSVCLSVAYDGIAALLCSVAASGAAAIGPVGSSGNEQQQQKRRKKHEIIIIKFEYISIQMKMEKRPVLVARVLEKSRGSDQRESFNRLCPAALRYYTAVVTFLKKKKKRLEKSFF
jgi:hypothetical protein